MWNRTGKFTEAWTQIERCYGIDCTHHIPAFSGPFTRPIPSKWTASELFELLEVWEHNNNKLWYLSYGQERQRHDEHQPNGSQCVGLFCLHLDNLNSYERWISDKSLRFFTFINANKENFTLDLCSAEFALKHHSKVKRFSKV